MHGCDYATVLAQSNSGFLFPQVLFAERISRSLFTYPLSYATKCFTYPLSHAEMRLIINESVRLCRVSRLSTITAVLYVDIFSYFFQTDTKCESTTMHIIFLVAPAKNHDRIILSGINRFTYIGLIYEGNILHPD